MPEGPAGTQRRALLFKIDNAPAAQPQAGLDLSDVVYEEVVEGGLTRFMAVVHSQDVPEIGPIRSVRPVDPVLAGSLGRPVLVFSGGAAAFLREVERAGIETRTQDSEWAKLFTRNRSRRAPHNVFTSSQAVYDSLAQKNGAPPEQWSFASTPLPGGTPAGTLKVTFAPRNVVTWTWDGATGRYRRMKGPNPQTVPSGAPVAFTNLVFQTVEMERTGVKDAAGNPAPSWKVVGNGNCFVARGATVTPCTWSRVAPSTPTRLQDQAGKPLALAAGTTWWSLVPSSGAVTAS